MFTRKLLHHRHSVQNRSSGFTLVELLVVIAIIGMLMGLLLPGINSARESGRRNTCLNNSRQIAIAMENYVGAKNRYPGYRGNEIQNSGTSGTGNLSNTKDVPWMVLMLPYLEATNEYELWKQNGNDGNGIFSLGTGATAIDNEKLYKELLVCPSDPLDRRNDAYLSYVVNSGIPERVSGAAEKKGDGLCPSPVTLPVGAAPSITNTNFYNNKATVTDGFERTLMIAENIQADRYYKLNEEDISFAWIDSSTISSEMRINGKGTGTAWSNPADLPKTAAAAGGTAVNRRAHPVLILGLRLFRLLQRAL